MNTILDAWCALCDHLAPFAAVALVPLLWIHHVETMPANDAAPDDADAPPLAVDDEPELEAWAA